MSARPRIYLDNAATSFPKPASVHEAMHLYATSLGASPGRGAYHESVEGGRLIARCRARLAALFNAPSPDHAVFTLNCSDALNLAINGTAHAHRLRRLRNPSSRPIHFIATRLDHNSVLRPLNALAADPLGHPVEWTCLPAERESGLVAPDALRAAIRPETALVIAVHASNVSGTLQPLADLGAVCRAAGVPFLVDAAQSAGRVPIDMDADAVDLLALPGHKYLMGPLGTGALIIRPGLEDRITPARTGGTGTVSESDIHPTTMPDRYEPGSHNTLGIVGLSEGIAWLNARTVDSLWHAEQQRIARILDALADAAAFPGLTVLGPSTPRHRVGVFSLTHDALAPAELAAILESEFGILTRAGIHCAPRAHEHFGTRDTGGATRISLGHFTADAHIETLLGALREICASTLPAR
jgi:cysteine desulfurase family protein